MMPDLPLLLAYNFSSLFTTRNLMIAGVAGAVILFMMLNKGGGAAIMKERRQKTIVFKPKAYDTVTGENIGGVVIVPGYGGIGVTANIVTLRWGRPLMVPRGVNPNAARKREEAYVARDRDGTPLCIAAGATKGYMDAPLHRSEYLERYEHAMSIIREKSIREGTAATILSTRLVVGIGVFGGLAFLAFVGVSLLGVYLRTHGYTFPTQP